MISYPCYNEVFGIMLGLYVILQMLHVADFVPMNKNVKRLDIFTLRKEEEKCILLSQISRV